MNILVERFGLGLGSTLGRLSIDGSPECYIEELALGDCIPAGTYKLGLRTEGDMTARYRQRFASSLKFVGSLWVLDVPGRDLIYIHCGNTPANTKGCLLTGSQPIMDGHGEFTVAYSTDAYRLIYPRISAAIQGDGATIEVRTREAA